MTAVCSLCKSSVSVVGCNDGWVCESCAEANRVGRDTTSQRAKLQQQALRAQVEMSVAQFRGEEVDASAGYAVESSMLLAMDDRARGIKAGAGGEIIPQCELRLHDTLAVPGVAACDASAERLRLVGQIGVDAVALAVDTADSIGASNSLERMLSAQLSVAHKLSMDYVARAALLQDATQSVKALNLALRAMSVFQDGLLTLKKLRGGGEQHIRLEHIDVRAGGQAAIGSFPGKGQQ